MDAKDHIEKLNKIKADYIKAEADAEKERKLLHTIKLREFKGDIEWKVELVTQIVALQQILKDKFGVTDEEVMLVMDHLRPTIRAATMMRFEDSMKEVEDITGPEPLEEFRKFMAE